MKNFRGKKIFACGAAAILLVSIIALARGTAADPQLGSITFGPIPAYHATPPKGPLGPTLPPKDFPGDKLSQRAYAAAAKIKPVLYQLPCYCHCDQEMGHTSLLSCWQDRHGSECGVCKMELYYAYEQHRKGKTPAQIRAGIIRGDWQKVDMKNWITPPAAKPASKSTTKPANRG